jgi:hypothetical protein
MPGGYIQLAALGSQDFYLTANPQISFFKTVYRRYTNFSMDFFRINPEGNLGLNDQEVVTYKFKIERNADLINQIYFNFTLPDIYSPDNLDFRWVKNIGFNIIEKASIYIGGSVIDEHYGEWFQVWHELTTPLDKKDVLDKMIGNVVEFYDPANAPGNLGLYPNASIVSGREKINIGPSILSRQIRVPLIFWFNRNPSLSIPLIALQYDPIQIDIMCKKITDLYTIIDTVESNDSYGMRIKPNPSDSRYSSRIGIQNFVSDTTMFAGEVGNKKLVNFSIEPFLDVNYIYLDTKEMKRFAQTEHKYLIEQVRQSTFKGLVGTSTLELQIHHPTSLMVIIPKRSDVENRNDWNNYTNWIDKKIPPYAINFQNEFYNEFELDDQGSEKATSSNFDFRKNINCLKNINLKLNGVDRFATQDPEYFNFLQAYSFAKTSPDDGIYPYSFSIDPFKYQPSGSCNMSRFNKIELTVETQPAPIPSGSSDYIYKYDVNVYTIHYNILRIVAGMGNVEFSN